MTAHASPVVQPALGPTAAVSPADPIVEPTAQPVGFEADEGVHVTVVLPCFNEETHVVAEVERIITAMEASGHTYEVLAIDDASTDTTLARLQEAQTRFATLRVVPFPRNGGTGTVRRVGSQLARGELVVWTDADMSYPNDRIPDLIETLDTNPTVDQVVGARRTEQGSHKALRVPAKWMIRKIAEGLTNATIPDLNSGLRAFRREVAQPYLRLLPPGFSCVTTITMAFLHNQHEIRYLPVDYAKRAGKSKFKFVKDAYRYILQVLRMVMYFNPLKVLMPPAMVLLVVGVGKGFYDVIANPVKIAMNTTLLFLTGMIIASMALLADLIVRSRAE